MRQGMVIDMNDEQLQTLADLQTLFGRHRSARFHGRGGRALRNHRNDSTTVRRFGHGRLKRVDKAVVLRFLESVSGYSRQPLTRLVK